MLGLQGDCFPEVLCPIFVEKKTLSSDIMIQFNARTKEK